MGYRYEDKPVLFNNEVAAGTKLFLKRFVLPLAAINLNEGAGIPSVATIFTNRPGFPLHLGKVKSVNRYQPVKI